MVTQVGVITKSQIFYHCADLMKPNLYSAHACPSSFHVAMVMIRPCVLLSNTFRCIQGVCIYMVHGEGAISLFLQPTFSWVAAASSSVSH